VTVALPPPPADSLRAALPPPRIVDARSVKGSLDFLGALVDLNATKK
jgi:hypothetical protein